MLRVLERSAMGLAFARLDPDGTPSRLAAGRFEAPAWLIASLGALVVALGVAHFVRRARRARRGRR